MERHLPYGMKHCYLPRDRGKRAPPSINPATKLTIHAALLDLPAAYPRGTKFVLTVAPLSQHHEYCISHFIATTNSYTSLHFCHTACT